MGEDLELLRHGLGQLPDRSRSALVLRELAGLSYAEIAAVLGVTEANVKVLIFRARRSLHELWDAVSADCEGVQLALSAAADGEQGRMSAARAKLHANHCGACSAFVRSVSDQRAGLAALVPIAAGVPGAKMAALAAAHTAGGKAGLWGGKAGGVWGAKTLIALLAAGATVTAGGVALEGSGLVGHPGHPAPTHLRGPTPPAGAARADNMGDLAGAAEERGPGAEDHGGPAGDADGSAAASSGDGESGGSSSAAADSGDGTAQTSEATFSGGGGSEDSGSTTDGSGTSGGDGTDSGSSSGSGGSGSGSTGSGDN